MVEKSRTRFKRRFAIRGVPRERFATSAAASSSIAMPRVRALLKTISFSSSGVYISRRQIIPNLSRKGFAIIPARVVAPISVNFLSEKRILRALGPLPTIISSA